MFGMIKVYINMHRHTKMKHNVNSSHFPVIFGRDIIAFLKTKALKNETCEVSVLLV